MDIVRYVVWSPEAPACMAFGDRAAADRYAEYWNDTRLLGRRSWRTAAIVGIAQGATGSRGTRLSAHAHARTQAANDHGPAPGASDRQVDAQARIDALQRRLEAAERCTQAALRESALRGQRIATLEATLAALAAQAPFGTG